MFAVIFGGECVCAGAHCVYDRVVAVAFALYLVKRVRRLETIGK